MSIAPERHQTILNVCDNGWEKKTLIELTRAIVVRHSSRMLGTVSVVPSSNQQPLQYVLVSDESRRSGLKNGTKTGREHPGNAPERDAAISSRY